MSKPPKMIQQRQPELTAPLAVATRFFIFSELITFTLSFIVPGEAFCFPCDNLSCGFKWGGAEESCNCSRLTAGAIRELMLP